MVSAHLGQTLVKTKYWDQGGGGGNIGYGGAQGCMLRDTKMSTSPTKPPSKPFLACFTRSRDIPLP